MTATLMKLLCRLRVICLIASLVPGTEIITEGSQPTGQTVTLRGCLLSEDGAPVTDGTIVVNGAQFEVADNGRYAAVVPENLVYSIEYSASQCYSIVHTFDNVETTSLDGTLPPVTLVRRRPGRVMLAFGGDTMMGRRYYDPLPGEKQWIRVGHEREDSQALLQHIKPYVELADYASVNLESTLIAEKPAAAADKAYTFYSHPATLPALAWAGVDYVCLGNNHIYDYLQPGLKSTLSVLERSSIAFSGAGLNEDQALAAHRENIQGVELSFLGFVGWKGKSTPSQVAEGSDKGGAAYGTMKNTLAAVTKEAAARAVVVMQYHGGEEYSYHPTGVTQKRLRAAIENGADLIVGHHPHVLQGFELHDGKLIAYSLGNFVFDQYRYETQRSAMLYVWMDGKEFHRAEIVPIHIRNYHATPATGSIRDFVLRNLVQRSALNELRITVSGGHGVISSDSDMRSDRQLRSSQQISRQLRIEEKGRLPLPWFQSLSDIQIRAGTATYRLGRDILLLGDFEQHSLFALSDCDWQFNRDESGVVDEVSHAGRCSLQIATPSAAENSTARQKQFIRLVDVSIDTPMSIAGYVKSSGPARLNVGVELWPSGWSQHRALESPPKKCLKTIDLPGGQWRHFAADIEPFAEGVVGFRIFLQNEACEQAADSSIYVDDLALVAWEMEESARAVCVDRLPLSAFNYLSLTNGSIPCPPIVLKITNLALPARTK